MAEPGDLVEVKTILETVEGILMPSFDENVLLIKLSTGYNIGFNRKEVLSVKLVEEKTEIIIKEKEVSKNSKLKTIAILHTGGTIASKVDYRTGGVATEFSPAELISLFPELKNIANIESELISQMWSDDLRFAHFTLIAEKIEEYVHRGVDGIIIGIGTDNLAVASAALSFIIEKTPVPIIFVGAQRSSDRGSSDAAMNVICAANFIVNSKFNGVAICMHSGSDDNNCYILPGNKTYKLHSSRRDAFKPVNSEAIAEINYVSGKIKILIKDHFTKCKELIIKPKMEEKVGLLKIHVNMFPEQFEFFQNYKGLIIEGTGLGHTPGQVPNNLCQVHQRIYPAIKELIDSGCVVVMTTQCIFGGVNMNVYDKGRDLLNIGVISGEDMLANTALVKLSWLLGNYEIKEVKEIMGKNIRGEINVQRNFEKDFFN